MFSTSSPTYPDSVKEVASQTAKGTDRVLARVSASKVFPHPVGPISNIFVFCSSTSEVVESFKTRLK